MGHQSLSTPTLVKFEYPNLLVKDYRHWCVTLRRHQATLGALVLIAKSEATAWSSLEPDAFSELSVVTRAIERTLSEAFDYEKINYLMLMMVDPNVHFHVLPRYDRALEFNGVTFEDTGWPKAPSLGDGPTLDDDMAEKLIAHLTSAWQA